MAISQRFAIWQMRSTNLFTNLIPIKEDFMFENYGMQELSTIEMEDVNGGGMIVEIIESAFNAFSVLATSIMNIWRAFW